MTGLLLFDDPDLQPQGPSLPPTVSAPTDLKAPARDPTHLSPPGVRHAVRMGAAVPREVLKGENAGLRASEVPWVYILIS